MGGLADGGSVQTELLQQIPCRAGAAEHVLHAYAAHRGGLLLAQNGADGFAQTADDVVLLGGDDLAALLCRLEDDLLVQGLNGVVNEARMAAEQLAAEGIHARVINIHTIKPLDEEIVLKAAKECGKVITAEEHSVIGGLGEAVCAVLSEKLPTPVRRVGVQDKFGCSGPAWDLLKLYGLDAATICKTAHEMLG